MFEAGGYPSRCNFSSYILVLLKIKETYAIITEKPNNPPTANFFYSPINPTTDDTIQFTDSSTDIDGNIISWSWNFGDGTTATTQNPAHQYTKHGKYTVTLQVTNSTGGTNQRPNKLHPGHSQCRDLTC
jgi:PKD repeat protein